MNGLAKRTRVAYSTDEIPYRMLRQNDPLALSLSIWNVDNNAKRFIQLRRYAWPRSVTVQQHIVLNMSERNIEFIITLRVCYSE